MTDLVTVKELAQEFRLDRSNVRKYILAQGFDFIKTRTPESKGQLTLALTLTDAEAIRELRENQGFVTTGKVVIDNGIGWFYLIQLIPDIAPQRVKLGFAGNVEGRLASHRTSAPTVKLIKAWPCKKVWERAIIDSMTRMDCQLVAGEVFDCADLLGLIQRCDDLFELFPTLS